VIDRTARRRFARLIVIAVAQFVPAISVAQAGVRKERADLL
jgi:hypothetical protein